MAHNKPRSTATATADPDTPPLPKADRQRLRLYMTDCREDPALLARACGMDELDILDWLDSPPIRRYLKLRDEFRRRAEAAAARLARERMLPQPVQCLIQIRTAMERAMADGRSQTSLRLAAQAYLRALAAADPETILAALPAPPSTSEPPAPDPTPPPPPPSPPTPPLTSSRATLTDLTSPPPPPPHPAQTGTGTSPPPGRSPSPVPCSSVPTGSTQTALSPAPGSAAARTHHPTQVHPVSGSRTTPPGS